MVNGVTILVKTNTQSSVSCVVKLYACCINRQYYDYLLILMKYACLFDYLNTSRDSYVCLSSFFHNLSSFFTKLY